MSEGRNIAAAMREAYEGFVKLCENDKEILSIRSAVEKSILIDSNVDIEEYRKKAKRVEDEISKLKQVINESNEKLNGLKNDIKLLEDSSDYIDIDVEEKKILDAAKETEKTFQKKMTTEIEYLENEKSKRLLEENEQYTKEVNKHTEKMNAALGDDYSAKALAFHNESLDLDQKLASAIGNENDEIEEKKADIIGVIDHCTMEREKILEDYALRLNKLQQQIDTIYDKYKDEINYCKNRVAAAEADRNDDITMAQTARSNIQSSYATQITRLEADFKRTDKDFQKQIHQAEKEKRPTTKLNTSKSSRLSSINMEITKCGNKRDVELSKQDSIIENLQQKHARNINPLQKALNSILVKQSAEISPLISKSNVVRKDQDEQVTAIDNRIDQENDSLESAMKAYKTRLANFEEEYQQKCADLLERMTQFAMNGTKEMDNIYQSALTPFRVLDEQKAEWEDAVKKASSFRPASFFEKRKEKICEEVKTTNYLDLVQLAEKSQQVVKTSSKLGFFPIVGIAVAVAAAVAAIIILSSNELPLGIALAVAIFCVVVFAYCRSTSAFIKTAVAYNFLAEKYPELSVIQEHAKTQTEDLEVSKLKKLGQELYDRFDVSNTTFFKVTSEHEQNIDNIKKEIAQGIHAEKSKFEAKKQNLKVETKEEIDRFSVEADKKNSSINRRKSNLSDALNTLADSISSNNDRLSEAEAFKVDLDAKIETLDEFAKYKSEYAQHQNAIQEDIESLSGNEEDVAFPNPLHFFGEKYNDKIEYMTALKHDFRSNIILYDSFERGTIVKSIEKFMKKFLLGIFYATDDGLPKEQYIIDITAGSSTFDTSEYKKAKITVIDEKNLDSTAAKLEKYCKDCRDRSDEYDCTSLGELNQALRDKRKNPLPYIVLHIIVPKRDQIDNASKLITASFKKLIVGDDEKNGLLVLFYVSKDEWYAPDEIADNSKKDEDIIVFIKNKLNNLNTEEIYLIDDETATLSVEQY